jgi:hypothetical protein
MTLICKAEYNTEIFWMSTQLSNYEGCSKCIAYFYLETSNFMLSQKCSFHALNLLLRLVSADVSNF